MLDLPSFLSQLLPWLPPFAIVALTNGGIAWWGRPLKNARYPLALFVTSSPLFVPRPEAYQAPWGVLTTVLTTLVIVTAARLPDWDTFIRSGRTRAESYAWLSLPMVRRKWHATFSERAKRALPFVGRGLLKLASWQLLFFAAHQLSLSHLPWPAKSAVLMLFFVLNLTATCDLLSAASLLLGFEIDLLFDAPLLSVSPRDFWSRRWNRFISRFALKHVALKLRKRASELVLIAAVFGVSGIFHEYFAWSVGGSRAGHGFMTLFFLIQGLVVWMGARLPPFPLPPQVGNALTFLWMTLTAPLFFRAVAPALGAFEYPNDWLPF